MHGNLLKNFAPPPRNVSNAVTANPTPGVLPLRIYACHESELAHNHDFVTMRAGRQPIIITRDGEGQLNALINPTYLRHYTAPPCRV